MRASDNLITRGLKKVLIVVSDDFPDIIDSARLAYPFADHKLVHHKRNVRKHMAKDDASVFNKELDKLRTSSADFDETISKFKLKCKAILLKISLIHKRYLRKSKVFLAHMRYPEDLRKYIYTTNSCRKRKQYDCKDKNKLRWLFSILKKF